MVFASVADKRATVANAEWTHRRSVLLLLFLVLGLPCAEPTGCPPARPSPGRGMSSDSVSWPVTWRSCAPCSRSRPGRWCPRCPSCCRSSASSCGASSRLLQTPTHTGHGGEKTNSTGRNLWPQETALGWSTSPRSKAAMRLLHSAVRAPSDVSGAPRTPISPQQAVSPVFSNRRHHPENSQSSSGGCIMEFHSTNTA